MAEAPYCHDVLLYRSGYESAPTNCSDWLRRGRCERAIGSRPQTVQRVVLATGSWCRTTLHGFRLRGEDIEEIREASEGEKLRDGSVQMRQNQSATVSAEHDVGANKFSDPDAIDVGDSAEVEDNPKAATRCQPADLTLQFPERLDSQPAARCQHGDTAHRPLIDDHSSLAGQGPASAIDLGPYHRRRACSRCSMARGCCHQ